MRAHLFEPELFVKRDGGGVRGLQVHFAGENGCRGPGELDDVTIQRRRDPAPDSDCRFGFTGARVGMAYPDSAMTVIRAELSPPVARRLLMSARTFNQDEALKDGLVDELVPRANVMYRAREIVNDTASIRAQDYSKVKEQVRGDTIQRLVEILTRERASAGGTWIAASDV